MGEIEAGGGGLAWAGVGGWVRIGLGDGCGAQTFQVRGRGISMPHWKRSQLTLYRDRGYPKWISNGRKHWMGV